MLNNTKFLSRNQKILRKSIEIAVFIFAFYILKYTHFFNSDIFISLFSNIILFSFILISFHGILYYYRRRYDGWMILYFDNLVLKLQAPLWTDDQDFERIKEITLLKTNDII